MKRISEINLPYNLSDLTSVEIKMLIKRHEDSPDDSTSRYIIMSKLRRELKFRHQENELDHTLHSSRNATNIKLLCKSMLHQLGYNQNSLYKSEGEILSDKLSSALNWDAVHCTSYSNEALAVCIIDEILNHYNSNYNERELLDLYQIPIDTFITLSTSCHKWCERNYWKPRITI